MPLGKPLGYADVHPMSWKMGFLIVVNMSKTSFKTTVEWQMMNWRKLERRVYKLQQRIYRASSRGDVKAVRKLQKMLMNSWSAKCLAVRQEMLNQAENKTANLAKNGKGLLRLLTVDYDRSPTLVQFALEPDLKARFNLNISDFQSDYSANNAIQAVVNSIRVQPKFVLSLNFLKALSCISYPALIQKLKNKNFLVNNFYPSGWSQCKIQNSKSKIEINFWLNLVLQAIQNRLNQYGDRVKSDTEGNCSGLSLICSADEIVILHEDLTVIQGCQKLMIEGLKKFGLCLELSDASIKHTLYSLGRGEKPGFDFLGFYIRQYEVGKYKAGSRNGEKLRFKTTIIPGEEQIQSYLNKIDEILDRYQSSSQKILIQRLNRMILEWKGYYSGFCSREIFSRLNQLIHLKLKAWAKKRHPNKSLSWIIQKYWQMVGNSRGRFAVRDRGEGMMLIELF